MMIYGSVGKMKLREKEKESESESERGNKILVVDKKDPPVHMTEN